VPAVCACSKNEIKKSEVIVPVHIPPQQIVRLLFTCAVYLILIIVEKNFREKFIAYLYLIQMTLL
jgi:hypothetical protein